MVLPQKDTIYADVFLKSLEKTETELGVFLAKAIKESKKIPEELKLGFISWVGMQEAKLAHLKANKELGRWYWTRTGKLTKKPWWQFWVKETKFDENPL